MKLEIKAFYHQFGVKERFRNLLRFLWAENGEAKGELTEYRMKVQVCGVVSSGNEASFVLKRAAQDGESELGTDVADFIKEEFYVDDGIVSRDYE